MNAPRVSPSVALAAYAEAWISGAKVVVFGDATSPLAQRLVERGARHVQVFDVDAARAAEAAAASSTKHISFTPLDMAGSQLRDGLYDVGIIEDLALARRNPKELLGPLVKALSKRGLALIGSRNPDITERLIPCAIEVEQPLGYYDFYETVSQHFEEVRMLGQTPFVGYAIADFSAADASEVRLDTALLPGGAEEPEWFLALASALPVSPDPFSVIQLPLGELELGTAGAGAEPDAAARARAEQAEARVATLDAELKKLSAERTREAERRDADKREAEKLAQKLESLEAELRRATTERAREAERSREAERRDAERREAERRVAERRDGERARTQRTEALESELRKRIEGLELELRKRDEWVAGLESRAATADQRADEVQAELDRLTSTQRKGRDQLGRLEQQLEEERRAKQRLEESSRALEQELEKRKRRGDADAQRNAELAQESKSLAARVEQLSSALADSEQRAKTLAARVEQLSKALAESEQRARKQAEEGDEESRAERAELEALLKERAGEVARLEAALHDTERFGRQLVVQLRELGEAREVPPPSPDVQTLVQRNAELSADLEAARWTISSLEANVGGGPTGSSTAVPRRDELPHSVPGADS
jgi:hypothetical protein